MLMQFQDFDEPYLDRLRSGDRSTEEHFVAYFSELIRLKVSRRLGFTAAIEDLRQETFARVLRVLAARGIRQPERLGAFVNSVCNNVLREHRRSACREIPADDAFVDSIPDRAISASDILVQRQMQREVRQILDELSEKDRRLMKALFLEERDKDEVCRDFGVNREYLRVLVHRAKQSFKSHYVQAMQRVPAQNSSARILSFPARQQACRNETFRHAGALTLQRSLKQVRRSKERCS
jgi:RNA polymerase sigma-70 factor (ECF subfamily)